MPDPRPQGEIVVEARDLTVRFGDFTAVDRVSFAVAKGEIFGFLGANGAGKTTTIRVLCGLLAPTSGEVRVCGLGFDPNDSAGAAGRAVKSKVGYMSQKFTLYDDLSVGENLEFTAALRKMSPERLRARQKELLDFIEFRFPTTTRVRDLPGGVKQQVSLAAALLHEPEVVFLDEPTAGVTPAARARFWDLIKKLVGGGTTAFVTTHYMDEAEQCGRIALMRAGQLIALDTPRGLKGATFPQGLLELVPKGDVPRSRIEEIKASHVFRLLEPYGLRWHAEVGDERLWREVEKKIAQDFDLHTIAPSLEDVFIRLVEGRDR